MQADPAAQPSSSSVAPAPSSSPREIDTSFVEGISADTGLTPREKNELASVLTHVDAPCASQAVSVAQCLGEHRACPDCDRSARYLASGVHQGWPAQ